MRCRNTKLIAGITYFQATKLAKSETGKQQAGKILNSFMDISENEESDSMQNPGDNTSASAASQRRQNDLGAFCDLSDSDEEIPKIVNYF